MNKSWLPQEQVLWFLRHHSPSQPLTQSLKTDVVIIGGGLTGITAAQAFQKKGLSVVLLEQYFCGGSASGRSSGFITADSELDLSHLTTMFGQAKAVQLWQFALRGVEHIRETILNYTIECDYKKEDTLIVANSHHAFGRIREEYEVRKQAGYGSSLYTAEQLPEIVTAQHYYGGVQYTGSFGINMFAYVQAVKDILINNGVQIFEETPVTTINNHHVQTASGFTVQAQHIIVAADHAAAQLDNTSIKKDIFHVQTCIMVSAPLTNAQVAALFPKSSLMMWDTDLIYQYFRLIDNNRFLIGGGSMLSSFSYRATCHPHYMYKKLSNYCKKKFPQLNLTFEYIWPGIIGISKDIIPIAGPDNKLSNVYYAGPTAGLSWAAAIGNYCAEHIVEGRNDLNDIFSPTRRFVFGRGFQFFFRKPPTFALSMLLTTKFPSLLKWLRGS